MSEFDKIDVCVRCEIREFCESLPADLSCEDAKEAYNYQRASEHRDYCFQYEPTYSPEDGAC